MHKRFRELPDWERELVSSSERGESPIQEISAEISFPAEWTKLDHGLGQIIKGLRRFNSLQYSSCDETRRINSQIYSISIRGREYKLTVNEADYFIGDLEDHQIVRLIQEAEAWFENNSDPSFQEPKTAARDYITFLLGMDHTILT